MLSDLYNLKYLLFFEIAALIVFALYGILPLLLILSAVVLCVTLFLAYNSPVYIIHILFFAILADSFWPKEHFSSFTSILAVEVLLGIFMPLCAIKFFSNLNKKIDIPKLALLWIPFLIWTLIIGVAVAIDQYRVITFWKNYFVAFFILCLIHFAVKNKIQVKFIIYSVIIWGALLSLIEIKVLLELGGFAIGLVGLFLKKNLLTLGWGRSNYLAAFFVIIIPLTISYMFFIKSRKTKAFLVVAIILMSFAIIITLSRGGILALLIALFFLFIRILKARTLVPFLILFTLIALVLVLNPLTFVLFDRIATLETSGSVYTRINFYEDIWRTFLQYPITGVGFGNLGLYATFILSSSDSPSAHNIILGALGETGIVGTILFLSVLGMLLKKAYSNYKNEDDESLKVLRWGFFVSILGGLIHTLAEPTFEGIQFTIMFWTIAGISDKLYLLKNH